MPIDADKILGKLIGEADKGQVNLYLDKATYKEFQKHCKGITPSKVVEAMLKEFIQSALHPAQPTASAEDLSPIRRELADVLSSLDDSEMPGLLEMAKALRDNPEATPLVAPSRRTTIVVHFVQSPAFTFSMKK